MVGGGSDEWLTCARATDRGCKSQYSNACSIQDKWSSLRQRLLKVIDLEQDNLRIYRLREPRERYVETYGKPLEFDLRDPLVL